MARRKHSEGIDDLVEKGRSQGGFVTYEELNTVLPPDILTGDQIDDVMEIFGENAIEVVDDFQKVPVPGATLLIGEEEAEEEEASVEEEPAVEEEEFEYPGGIKGNDPVRLYLKEMGAIPLLNREGEVSLAKRIEDGEREIVSSVKGCSIALDELFKVGEKLKVCPHLVPAGLMTMGPLSGGPEAARPCFRRLRELLAALRAEGLAPETCTGLSMGMTGDFEVAVEEGATVVRIGTAFFG